MKENRNIMPNPLLPGDCVGLIAPASPISYAEQIKCVEFLEKLGYEVIIGNTLGKNRSAEDFKQAVKCSNVYGHIAGTAKERGTDINDMFENTEVKAVFCTRGGYGSAEILEYLDYEMIRRNPKIFVGYSDITSVHTVLQKYCGLVTFHGPMVRSDLVTTEKVSVADMAFAMKSLYSACNMDKRLVFRNPPGEEFIPICFGKNGNRLAEGRLFGGNLSVLTRAVGTPFSPIGNGEILFLEDVGENIPRIHMYLTQMKYAGMFEGVRGILLGGFTENGSEKCDTTLSPYTFLKEWFEPWGLPVLGNVCSDHRIPMGTLPLGGWCKMDVENHYLCFRRYYENVDNIFY